MYKYFSFIGICFLLSCANKDFAKKYSFSEKTFGPQIFYYTLTNSSELTAEANNKTVVTKNTATLSFIYQLETDSLGNRLVKITYDKLYISVKKNDDNADVYNSEAKEENLQLIDKVLKSVKGSTISIVADKTGKVLSTKGAKEISDKVIAALPNYEDGSTEIIKHQLENFIGEKFVKDNIVQNLTLLPDSALAIGSTWTQKTEVPGELPLSATVTYALESVENGIGIIHSSADFTNVDGKQINVLGMTAAADLKGKITGDYKALEKSGFLISAETNMKIEGTVSVSGKDIPVSIKTKKIIEARDMKK